MLIYLFFGHFLLFNSTRSLFLKLATNFCIGIHYVNRRSFSLKNELSVFHTNLRRIWLCKFALDQFNELVFILGVLGTLRVYNFSLES